MGSLREDIEATSATLADSTSVDTAPTETTTTTTAPEPSLEATSTEAPTEATETPVARPDGRDDKGRFAKPTAGNPPGQAAPPKAPPTTEGAASSTQTPKTAETTATEAPKHGEADTSFAPPSWKIGARNVWDKVPPEARAESHRRELEMQQFVTKSAPARQLADDVQRTLAPIAASIQARGTTPQKLIASYVQFDQALSSRDPAAQAQAVAQVIKGYGIPIEALADAIDGKLQHQQRQLSPDEIREQLRAEMRQEMQQHQQRAEYQSHSTRVQEFAKTVDRTLFNDDVRHDMAALIESAASRQVELSLQEAFDRAVMANPEARAIVQQREAAKRAATQQQATQRAEAAGSSVKSRPASPVGGGKSGNSLRADLEAAAAQIGGRT